MAITATRLVTSSWGPISWTADAWSTLQSAQVPSASPLKNQWDSANPAVYEDIDSPCSRVRPLPGEIEKVFHVHHFQVISWIQNIFWWVNSGIRWKRKSISWDRLNKKRNFECIVQMLNLDTVKSCFRHIVTTEQGKRAVLSRKVLSNPNFFIFFYFIFFFLTSCIVLCTWSKSNRRSIIMSLIHPSYVAHTSIRTYF